MTEVSNTDNVPFALKFAVYFMGVLLVGGTIALVIMMFVRTGNKEEYPAVVSTDISVDENAIQNTNLDDMVETVLPASAHTQVRSINYNDGVLAIHLCDQNGSTIILLHVATEKIIRRVALRPSAGCAVD